MKKQIKLSKGTNYGILHNTFNNLSTWIIISSNALGLFLAYNQKLGVLTIMWVYWIESIIIGLFNFVNILTLKDFSTENFEFNNQPVRNSNQKIQVAFFFLFHYGLFHIIYAGFLLFSKIFLRLGKVSIKSLMLISLVYFLNHALSFAFYKIKIKTKENIGKLMFRPYLRIIPIQLFLSFSAFLSFFSIPLFFLLKTVAEVLLQAFDNYKNSK